MNCRACESLLLRECDGALTPAEHTALSAHLAGCAVCRNFKSRLDEIPDLVRADAAAVPVPDAAMAWRRLQSHLQVRPARPRRRSVNPLWWVGAPLAAAAAVAFAFISQLPSRPASAPKAAAAGPAAPAVTQVDYVEAGDPNAATMVYVDKPSGWLVVWASDAAVKDQG